MGWPYEYLLEALINLGLSQDKPLPPNLKYGVIIPIYGTELGVRIIEIRYLIIIKQHINAKYPKY